MLPTPETPGIPSHYQLFMAAQERENENENERVRERERELRLGWSGKWEHGA